MEECLWLIRYGITPEAGMGRAELPLAVATWTPAVQACLNRIEYEAAQAAAKKGGSGDAG